MTRTFVQLADSLVDEFDIIDLLTMLADRCVELLDVTAAGILLADGDGKLRVMAASSEAVRLLELFQLQNDEGPCLEAHSGGKPVVVGDLADASKRWPRFAPEAVSAGFRSVYAIPLRLRSSTIGALNLFRAKPEVLPEDDVVVARAMADVASIAILQDQSLRESQVLAGQLQHALDSRVTIEQAKGMLAERGQVPMEEAFRRLRIYARNNNHQLTAVAFAVVNGDLQLDQISAPPAGHAGKRRGN
ncbi:MAG TPA: GAF and ANTAR domain-containing protein [Acidimicrobiales bacterium]|nr:GAF and ANTAR domain-containing protein [Acidimicrobiales bacterium]